ncbi:MAG: tripartite tricarboxylate transporter substrate binding protein [Herminiimonas sp.]|nr:tripartite tricarboxylate transporter substrate binding protein [Herminiimonas sp.]
MSGDGFKNRRGTARVLRTAGLSLLALASGLVATQAAHAQTWPAKPVRIIVSFAPGGVTDTIARALQPRLAEGLGQPVIIDNRPGAGGTIAEGLLARSAPDGYTLMMSADGVPASPHLIRNLPYDTFKDLQPVSMLVRVPLVLLVNSSVPATNVQQFVSYARSRPGQVSYASPGTGTSNHLFLESFKDIAGFEMQHVPYKGGGPAMTDVMAGHVQAILISSTLAAPQVSAGKVKALAVTSEKRAASMPNVPTFTEAGYPNFKPQTWTGLFLPAGTPPAIAQRIHAEFAKAIKAPEVVTRLRDLGAEPVMSSPTEFAAHLRSEHDSLGKLIRERKITAD